MPEARRPHTDRPEEHVVGQIGPRCRGRGGRRLGGRGEPEVRVGVGVAEWLQRLESQAVENVFLRIAEVFEQVADVLGEPASVREHIRQRHVLSCVRIAQGEVGQIFDDRIRPFHKSAPDRAGHHG